MSRTLTFAPLPSRALIAVGGPDWRGFLQGLITQDVDTLQPGEARFGALLTPQGRLLYDLFVIGREDGCWLDVAAEHRPAILQRLTMYRLRAKVEIVQSDLPVSAAFKPLPLAGRGWGGGAGSDSASSTQTPPHPTLSPSPPPLGVASEARGAGSPRDPVGGEGYVADPRLAALGWRGYGVEASEDE